ncbi:MAG TPA: type III pantothenate kinase [Sulfuricurvum sp.]|nr:type III pantothenate kinase [Sulfuricurvum sp.]
MILCDIGNTSVDWYIHGECSKQGIDEFAPSGLTEIVYYICVNAKFESTLNGLENWINISSLIEWDNYYPTMGIDRIMVCEAVRDGVIVDAGSAITVDRVHDGKFQGGFIALGVRAAQEAYARLSPALSVSFNFEVDLDKMAKNTPDAITVGFLAPLIHEIKSLGRPIYVTGGDAEVLSSFIEEAVVDRSLIFKGMQKLIEKGKVC